VTKWLGLVFLLLAACAKVPTIVAIPVPDPAVNQNQKERHRQAVAHTELAAGYYQTRKFAVALDELRAAVAADPSYSQAYNMLGLVYMELGETSVAEDYFRQALKKDPGNSDAHNNYGTFLCKYERYDESIAQFLAAAKNPLFESPENSYENAGMCASRKGDYSATEDYFLKALRLKKNLPKSLYGMADINYLQGRYQSAKYYIERFLKEGQPTPSGLWLAVKIGRRLGDRGAEASYALQLRHQFPDSAEALALRDGKFE
jgi:type IV pilus assembly protein PilF